MGKIIQRKRSMIPACDVDIGKFREIVSQTHNIPEVGGYKIPAISGLDGWRSWVEKARMYTKKPLIYDHQKAGTDVPDTAEKFMECLSEAGFNAVILFPRTNDYKTHEAWVKASQDHGLGVIVGGEMTHQQNPPHYSEIMDIYSDAAGFGVRDFVVPGNKPDSIRRIRGIIEANIGLTNVSYYAPGFIAQGGKISEGAMAAGKRFHAIVGRGIYQAEDIRQATLDLTKNL